MNDTRRKMLERLVEKLKIIKNDLKELYDEEEEYMVYGIPDNMFNSKRYDKAEAAVADLEEALERLDDVILDINNAIVNLNP